MSKRVSLSVFSAVAIFAVIAVPANADDIEAKVQTCSQCHGANGEPTDPKVIPVIWGQREDYLYKELHDYHSGDRASPIMGPAVHDISLEDLRKVAAYFAAKTWPCSTPARRDRCRPASPRKSRCAGPAISRISRAARRRRGLRA